MGGRETDKEITSFESQLQSLLNPPCSGLYLQLISCICFGNQPCIVPFIVELM